MAGPSSWKTAPLVEIGLCPAKGSQNSPRKSPPSNWRGSGARRASFSHETLHRARRGIFSRGSDDGHRHRRVCHPRHREPASDRPEVAADRHRRTRRLTILGALEADLRLANSSKSPLFAIDRQATNTQGAPSPIFLNSDGSPVATSGGATYRLIVENLTPLPALPTPADTYRCRAEGLLAGGRQRKEDGKPETLCRAGGSLSRHAAPSSPRPMKSSSPRAVTGAPPPIGTAAFTILEMLVAMAVLALISSVVLLIIQSTSSTIRASDSRQEAASQARQALGRLAIDLASQIRRTDIAYGYATTNGGDFTGNDRLGFYTEATSYKGRDTSLVEYRINPATAELERGIAALNWEIRSAFFLPAAQRDTFRASSPPSPTRDFQTLSPQIFRMEVCYLSLDAAGQRVVGIPSASARKSAVCSRSSSASPLDTQTRAQLTPAQVPISCHPVARSRSQRRARRHVVRAARQRCIGLPGGSARGARRAGAHLPEIFPPSSESHFFIPAASRRARRRALPPRPAHLPRGGLLSRALLERRVSSGNTARERATLLSAASRRIWFPTSSRKCGRATLPPTPPAAPSPRRIACRKATRPRRASPRPTA